ncbi:ABC transporter permease subunit [Yinghuangia aomiensis]
MTCSARCKRTTSSRRAQGPLDAVRAVPARAAAVVVLADHHLGPHPGRLIGGTVIVEVYFSIPGLGQSIVRAIQANNDVPVVQGTVVVIAVGYVLLNALVDIGYMLIDPE